MSDVSQLLRIKLLLEGVSSMQSGLSAISGSVLGLAHFSSGLAAEMAALGGISSLKDKAKEVIELGKSLDVMHNRLNASVGDIMTISRLLKEEGGSAEGAGLLLAHMQKAIATAAETGGAAAEVFSKLGINIDELVKENGGEQFRQIARGIASIGNSAERTKIEMALFGRSGYELGSVIGNIKEFNEAFSKTSEYVSVMSRNSSMFHEISNNLDRLALNGRKFMAGIMDQIGSLVSSLAQTLGDIDLTVAGEKLGAFAMVVVRAWKDNRFPEMIGLLIEAGFELGGIAAERILYSIIGETGSNAINQLVGALINGVMTFGVKLSELFVNLASVTVAMAGSLFRWLYEQGRERFQMLGNFLKDVFSVAINFWAEQIENLINRLQKTLSGVIPGWANMPKLILGRSTPDHSKTDEARSLKDIYADFYSVAKDGGENINKSLDDYLARARQIVNENFGFKSIFSFDGSALQKLRTLIDAAMKARSLIGSGDGSKTTIQNSTDAYQKLLMISLQRQELTLKASLIDLESKLEKVETDRSLTEVEKWEKKRDIYAQEIFALNKIVNSMKERAAIERGLGNEEKAKTIDSEMQGFQKKGIGVSKQLDGLGSDPNSFSQQFSDAFIKIKNEWGTWATQMATSFKTVFTGAVSSISNGITGLIMGTKTWGQALREIGNSIMTSVVQSIVQMGVQWVMTHVIMRGAMALTHAIGTALGWKSTSETIAQETAKAPVLATNAATASVSSFGASAIIGMVAAIAAIGLIIAAATGSFMSGGYTGSGGKSEVAGVAHRGEFYFTKEQTEAIGISNLEAIAAGGSSYGVGNNFSSGVAQANNNVNVEGHNIKLVMVPSERHAVQEILNSDPGQKTQLLKWMKDNRREFGVV